MMNKTLFCWSFWFQMLINYIDLLLLIYYTYFKMSNKVNEMIGNKKQNKKTEIMKK